MDFMRIKKKKHIIVDTIDDFLSKWASRVLFYVTFLLQTIIILYHLKSKYLSDYHNIAHAFYYQSVIIIFVIMEILWTKLTDTYTQVVWVKVLLFIGFFACQTTRKM